jgi:hypothetical protein
VLVGVEPVLLEALNRCFVGLQKCCKPTFLSRSTTKCLLRAFSFGILADITGALPTPSKHCDDG